MAADLEDYPASLARGKLFYRLVQQAVEVEPVYWADIAAARRTRDHNK